MLKIRLSRTGKKAQPSFRLVLQEHTAATKGKFIEILGHYRPDKKSRLLEVKKDRVKHWLSVGAKPSDTVAVLLKGQDFEGMDKFMDPRNKKRKAKKESSEKPAGQVVPSAETKSE